MRVDEYICMACKKVIYEDDLLCDKCKTSDNIDVWGDPVLDEDRIKIELVGEYPKHHEYWEKYKVAQLNKQHKTN